MALVYTIRRPTDIVSALVANDEFLGRILKYAVDFYDDYQSDFLMKELYAAPYCFVEWTHQSKSHYGDPLGFLIFTSMVPWMHDIYQHVRDEMDHQRRNMVPYLYENVDQFLQRYLGQTDGNGVHTFTKHRCYPTVNDLRENDLDEQAMTATCAAMRWEIPSDWRNWRQDGLNWLQMKSSPTIDDFMNFKANQSRTTRDDNIQKGDVPAEISIRAISEEMD